MKLVNIFLTTILNVFSVSAINLLHRSSTSNRRFKCVSELSNSALTWITPLDTKYINQHPSDSYPNPSEIYNISDDWLYESFDENDINGGYILDEQWQSFETKVTTGQDKGYYSEFTKFGTLGKGNVPFSFSVRIESEAHLYMCQSGEEPPSNKCYWIIIGGWKGTESAIRKCEIGGIPSISKAYAEAPCSDKKHMVFENPLNGSEWKHFNIEIKDSYLNIYIHGRTEPFLRTIFDNNFSYSTLYVRSINNQVGFWKLHKYSQYINRNIKEESKFITLKTDQKVCFTMYVSFCANCRLAVRVRERNSVIYEQYYENEKNENWIKIDINETAGKREHDWVLYFGMSQGETPVAVRNFKKCQGLNIISLQVEGTRNTNVACSSLLNSKDMVEFSGKSNNIIKYNCQYNQFGEHCISCSKIYKTDFCEKTLICETGKCYCAPGYSGKYCNTECPTNKFGYDCEESCGHCKNDGCNKVNGACGSGCTKYFTGQQCKEYIYPVIRIPPKMKSKCYTKCEIEFNLMDYTGQIEPLYYKIQKYMSTYWRDIHKGRIYENSFILENLAISTDYKIRIILCVQVDCSEDTEVPTSTITTTCKELTREDVKITTESTFLQININKTDEMCYLHNYKYFLEAQAPRVMLEENKIFNLLPYTDYTLYVKNVRTSFTFKMDFKTKEDQPSVVRNIKATPSETDIHLNWSEPTQPNGIIKAYKISYQFYSKVDGCTINSNMQNESFSVTNKEYTILELQPYSIYNIYISAINMHYEGNSVGLKVETLPSKELDIESYVLQQVSSTRSEVYIELKKNCEKIQSPTYLSAELKCFHNWCTTDHNKRSAPNHNYLIKFSGLFPFTNYTAEVFIRKEMPLINQILLSSANVTTKPDRPKRLEDVTIYSRVRSQNEDYFWFSWAEPTYPTGILEEIIITAYYYYWTWRKNSIIHLIPDRCKIWRTRYCAVLNISNTNNDYTLQIQAKNRDVEEYSENFDYNLNIKRWENVPTAIPQNFESVWDNDFNLHLKWQHPSFTVGQLKGFNIFVNKKEIYDTASEYLTYSYKHIFPENDVIKSEEFFVEIEAVTSSDKSQRNKLKVKSPPALPILEDSPKISNIKNNSISLKIPKIKNIYSKGIIFVIITQDISKTSENNVCDLGKLGIKTDEKKKWIAVEINNVNQENEVEIGGGKSMYSQFLQCYLNNANLVVGSEYQIDIVTMNIRNNFTRYFKYTLMTSTGAVMDEDSSTLAIFITILIISLCCVGIGIYYIRKKNVRLQLFNMIRFPINEANVILAPLPEPLPLNHKVMENKLNETDDNEFSRYTKLVKIANLENYIRESIRSGELDKQHASLKTMDEILCTYGKKEENKAKNRYANIIPYDHNRVILSKIDNDAFSDYINANYINGINCAKAYIAAQAPKTNTLNDFWRMIWEQKVENIIMLTSIYEGMKKKSEKYWPDMGEKLEFRGIVVEHFSVDVYPDFQSRVLAVTYGNVKRKINHLYYTNWPDHDVPLYPYSLVQFVGKILSIPEGKAPVLVHCSAGVGRTGTIILIDLCLRMVDKHGAMDIFFHQKQLREQRPNMVDTAQQYKFAHLVLLECLITPKTEIECNECFETAMANIDIQAQIDYIQNSAWYENVLVKKSKYEIVIDPEKNRFQDIVPENYGIIYLSPTTSNGSSGYINAVTVDNFMLQNQFIATQQPMPQTLSDFWKLVYEYEIEVIMSLQEIDLKDPTCCEFWPTAAKEKLVVQDRSTKHFVLSYLKTETHIGYESITINMKYKKESRSVTIIALKNWHYGQDCPENSHVFLAMSTEMHHLVPNRNKIITTCKDGATGCGLYIAMCFLLEKIKFEQICDVCHTVRIIRRSRKQFIPNKAQFSYLYEIAKLYMKEFEIYSNFSK